jgi:hypothetical protein
MREKALQAASSVWKKKSSKINSICNKMLSKALQIGLEPTDSSVVCTMRKEKVQFYKILQICS